MFLYVSAACLMLLCVNLISSAAFMPNRMWVYVMKMMKNIETLLRHNYVNNQSYNRLLPAIINWICPKIVIHVLIEFLPRCGAQPSGLRLVGPSNACLMLLWHYFDRPGRLMPVRCLIYIRYQHVYTTYQDNIYMIIYTMRLLPILMLCINST